MRDIGGLHRTIDDEIKITRTPRDHQIIENAAIVREQQRIAQRAPRKPGDIAGKQCFKRLVLGQGHEQLPHV